MDREALQRLVANAQDDPAFLHALVFDPESVLQQLDYIDRRAKARLVANSPDEIIATLCGARALAGAAHDDAP